MTKTSFLKFIALQLSNFFVLKKIKCDFTKTLLNEKYDLIYFDAFSPSKQPEMWVLNNFKKLYDCLNSNGILITYSSKGDVKRIMKKVLSILTLNQEIHF